MTTAVEAAAAGRGPLDRENRRSRSVEPNVIAFACHYCAFAAADLAGVMRLSYPQRQGHPAALHRQARPYAPLAGV